MPRIEVGRDFIHERLRDPEDFIPNGMRRGIGGRSKFKTIKRGRHRIVLGKLKSTGKVRAQKIEHPIDEASRGGKFSCHSGVCRRYR